MAKVSLFIISSINLFIITNSQNDPGCSECTALKPCQHENMGDDSCLEPILPGVCAEGSYLCPGLSLSPTVTPPTESPTVYVTTSEPTSPPTSCGNCTPGSPCHHENLGDDTCLPEILPGVCAEGSYLCPGLSLSPTVETPEPSAQPTVSPAEPTMAPIACGDCTEELPCQHENLGDNTCLGSLLPGVCAEGSFWCPNIPIITSSPTASTPEPTSDPTATPSVAPTTQAQADDPGTLAPTTPTLDPTPLPTTPTMAPTAVCDKVCSPATTGLPCMHKSPGDNTCVGYIIGNQCPSGSVDCDFDEFCDICSATYPCRNNAAPVCYPPQSTEDADGNIILSCNSGTTTCPLGPFAAKVQSELNTIMNETKLNKEMITYTMILTGVVSFIVGVLCLGIVLFIGHKLGCKIDCRTRNIKYGFKQIDINDSEITTDVVHQI